MFVLQTGGTRWHQGEKTSFPLTLSRRGSFFLLSQPTYCSEIERRGGEKLNKLFLTRVAVPMIIVAAITALFPWFTRIELTNVSHNGRCWVVEGFITIDVAKLPEEHTRIRPEGWSWYNHDPNGMLPWYEQHVNEVLADHGIHAVKVAVLELWWESIGDTVDVIGFHVEFSVGKEVRISE